MTRIKEISNGTKSISLLETGATGIIAERGGFGRSKFAPHQLEEALGIEEKVFVEHYKLVYKGSSHDDLGDQTQEFIELLKEAYKHFKDPLRFPPVYVKEQTGSETNPRFALIYMSPEISNPDFLTHPFELDNYIQSQGVNIARFVWRSHAPGSMPTVLTIEETDGAASPTEVHISNFRDVAAITDVKNYDDSGTTFSDVTPGDTLLPDPIGEDDYVAFGSTDQPIKNIVIPKLSTAGVITTETLGLEYYNGAWIALTLGTDYTIFPGSDLELSLEQSSQDIVINVNPPDDATKLTLDGSNCYWIRLIEENAAPVYGTDPITHATESIYAQSTPEVRIQDDLMLGDPPPYILAKMQAPAGGDENEGFSSLSKIIAGLKSDPGDFVSHLNLGGEDNPTDWGVAVGTDASLVADTTAPGGKHLAVDFSGDETLVNRLSITGDGKLGDWLGEYRAFLVLEQISGAAGDLRFMLRTYIHETNTYSPKYDSDIVATAAADQPFEILDMGILNIPFGEVHSVDDWTDADIVFQIHAERTTGAATFEGMELILIPIKEWAVEWDDPLIDVVNGSSALRGANILEDDGGILANRTVVRMISGANSYVAFRWLRGGNPIKIDPRTESRLYFILMHFPSGGTWGTPPLSANPGCHLSVKLYAHFCYYALRGSN